MKWIEMRPWFVMVAGCAAACAGDGALETLVSGQIVGVDETPIGPGLVLVEKGPVHDGSYQLGGKISRRGRFTIELTGGGTWGLHLFHDDYTYLPMEITIEEHQQVVLTSMNVKWGVWMDLTGMPTWPDQPSDARLVRMPPDDNFDDNPVIRDLTMTYVTADIVEITADVYDPDSDLSRLILVHDAETGGGWAMNPPSPPDSAGNYPNGIYTLTVYLDARHQPGTSKWLFVVSDNNCNNSPILERVLPEP